MMLFPFSLEENSPVPKVLILFVGLICALLSTDLKERQNYGVRKPVMESQAGR